MSQDKIDMLQRALAREKLARKQAEKILENKAAELYEAKQKLEKSYAELETLLNKTDSQLQGVFENIVDAYVIIDLEGNILKVNDAAVSLLGLTNSNEDFNLLNLVKPNEMERVAQSFKMLLNTGSITDFSVTILTDKKVEKLVHINASIIYDDGIPVAAQGIVRDITLQRKYRKSLETEKLKYYNIISNMNLGLVEVDLNDRIIMVNQSLLNMTGYTEEELVGKHGVNLLPVDDDRDLLEEKINERRRGKTESYELRIKKKDGEVRYWLVSGAPNYDLDGNITGSIGINFDITELKNLQLQKENLLEKLAKSNDDLQEYAHIVSHDLKSPLRSINALVTWVKQDNEGKLDPVTMQNLDLVDVTLEKMEQLITDVLNYSSVGTNENEKVDVDLDVVITELVKIMYKPDHIKVSFLNKLPVIRGDKTKLQQVFQNLISNSIKFIDKSSGSIVIDVEDLKSHYKFSIKDNGIGIEKKYHDKIFKIFHSLKKSKESSGIGLSIVKKIIDLHEGKIWLDSEPNVGTTFYFTLKK
ncbi:PAS domain S-box protein [Algibacter sp. AS12]|uniref:PAS domain-containing sensor histidine kinase n=1 Tax=Algibacter sp. AS12 TaxID=3135773 RepID=UPI00398ABD37